ncbi:MAG: hypothetical protein JEZ14_25440 [Marinilabiliaceae bacterium]|nr:hypothetical protein [Marinilabiliaceae bacterium]
MSEKDLFDPGLKSLLRESKLEMPFPDFEARLMETIKSDCVKRKSVLKDIRLSWLFFTIGSIFGLLATFILPALNSSILGIDIQYLQYPLMILVSVVIVWQLDAMIKITVRQKYRD